MKLETISANGMKFVVGTHGTGPRLLFITGTGADLRQPDGPLNSPLVEQFEVMTYDQRGMGRSDKPDIAYAMKDYADDAAALMDAVGWDQALIIGYSFGGMVAQELAIRSPEKVSKLVLASCAAGGAGGSSYPLHELVDLSPREKAIKGLELADMRFSEKWCAENPEEAEEKIRTSMQSADEFMDEPDARAGARRQLAARAEHNTFDRLGGIQAETLVLAGQFDGIAALPAQRAMAEAIPDCHLEIVGAPHDVFGGCPGVYELLRTFF